MGCDQGGACSGFTKHEVGAESIGRPHPESARSSRSPIPQERWTATEYNWIASPQPRGASGRRRGATTRLRWRTRSPVPAGPTADAIPSAGPAAAETARLQDIVPASSPSARRHVIAAAAIDSSSTHTSGDSPSMWCSHGPWCAPGRTTDGGSMRSQWSSAPLIAQALRSVCPRPRRPPAPPERLRGERGLQLPRLVPVLPDDPISRRHPLEFVVARTHHASGFRLCHG